METRENYFACPDKPNCASSTEDRAEYAIDPLTYEGTIADAKMRLLDVIHSFPRSQVIEIKEDYIRSTFTSFFFRFIDDVEFQLVDDAKLIHVKSASRLGYWDLGVNRRRCETIRNKFSR